MNFEPYLAIDTETTGIIPEKNRVLQVAAILDDLKSPIDQLPQINFLVNWEREGLNLMHTNYALGINGWIFKELCAKESKYVRLFPEEARAYWTQWLTYLADKYNITKFTPSGKNFGGFDGPFLKNSGFDISRLKHRVLDPGPMYVKDFGFVPSLDQINERLLRKGVSHNALEDCIDVIVAVRNKLGIPL